MLPLFLNYWKKDEILFSVGENGMHNNDNWCYIYDNKDRLNWFVVSRILLYKVRNIQETKNHLLKIVILCSLFFL